MKVLLLAGGTSNERAVSLRSGEAVRQALESRGHSVVTYDPQNEGDIATLTNDIDVVFLALHGEGGEDGTLQAKLSELRVPYVGSDPAASKLCFDKAAYKKFLQAEDIPVVAGQVVTEADINADIFTSPYVLKPISGGSSLDTLIVRSPDAATTHTANDLLKKYPHMLYEPLISGVEITVGVLDDTALPIVEIIPPEGAEFDYDNKYNGKTQELCPPLHVSESRQHEAKLLAERVHELCGCRHMSRTDMIIDQSGAIHILETNTIPGLTSESLLPKMAQEAGLEMPDLIDKLVQLASQESA